MPRKPASKAYRDQLRERLVGLGVGGHQLIEQLVADLMRCGCRPREAWRLAWELTQDEAAARFNQVRGDPEIRMRGSRICEYEKWPMGGVRPSVRALKILAAIYETTWDQLVDVNDLEEMPARDRQAFLDISGLRFSDSRDLPVPRESRRSPSAPFLGDDPQVNRPVTAEEVAAVCEPLPIGLGGRVVSAQVHSSARAVGREEELAALRAVFSTGGVSRRPVLRVLTGLGGVGKTSLARAYAQRHLDDYGVVWWVRAEDPSAIPNEFRTLLEILAPQDAAAVADPVAAVHSLLAGRPDRWLLVLDNVPDPPALYGLVPAAGAGDLLVTSRAGIWPDRRLVLPVTPLAESAAVQLLTSLSGDPDRATAATLAQELGGLPLALAQAGSYVAQNLLDLGGYLALYRRRRAELHREGYVPDYPATVATTWQLAFDRLPSPSRALLHLLTWYAPDAIPLDRLFTSDTDQVELSEQVDELLRPVLVDEIHRHHGTTELITYGLITIAGPEGSVTVHRLVQAVTADHLAADNCSGAWINAAAALLAAACPQSPATWVTTTAWQRLQTHVRTVINHLPPALPITFRLRVILAVWTGQAGDVVGARELYASVVQDAERVLGPNHIESLVGRTNLAYWTGQAGDVVRARELSAAVVEDEERVLGPDNAFTLIARTNLAYWTGQAGDVVRARELFAAVVEDEERVLGPDNRQTLDGRCDLARWTGEAGDTATARNLLAAVVKDAARVLGPNDRLTLMARFHLARWTGEAGAAAWAREQFTALVDDDERVLGPDDPYTLDARFHLARWTEKTGDAARARELLAAVEQDAERVLGPGYRNTLRGRHWYDSRTSLHSQSSAYPLSSGDSTT